MELTNGTDGALAVSEPEEGVAASTPGLAIIKGGLADEPETRLEKPPERFHVVGIDRVGGLTILRGTDAKGQPLAIVTHIPPELLLPAEDGKPDTAFQRLREGFLGKAASVLALAGAGLGIASMAGCAPDDENRGKVGCGKPRQNYPRSGSKIHAGGILE